LSFSHVKSSSLRGLEESCEAAPSTPSPGFQELLKRKFGAIVHGDALLIVQINSRISIGSQQVLFLEKGGFEKGNLGN